MKNQFMSSAMTIIIALTLFSYKPSKSIQSVTKGSNEVSVQQSEVKYKSDKDFFRAKSSANNTDEAKAKKKALINAKNEMAKNLSSFIKALTEQYIYQRGVADKKDYERKFEETTSHVVSQSIDDVRVIDEKLVKETNGTFTYLIVIEMSKTTLIRILHQTISQDSRLQSEYDKQEFEQIFNAEMDKFAKQQ